MHKNSKLPLKSHLPQNDPGLHGIFSGKTIRSVNVLLLKLLKQPLQFLVFQKMNPKMLLPLLLFATIPICSRLSLQSMSTVFSSCFALTQIKPSLTLCAKVSERDSGHGQTPLNQATLKLGTTHTDLCQIPLTGSFSDINVMKKSNLVRTRTPLAQHYCLEFIACHLVSSQNHIWTNYV